MGRRWCNLSMADQLLKPCEGRDKIKQAHIKNKEVVMTKVRMTFLLAVVLSVAGCGSSNSLPIYGKWKETHYTDDNGSGNTQDISTRVIKIRPKEIVDGMTFNKKDYRVLHVKSYSFSGSKKLYVPTKTGAARIKRFKYYSACFDSGVCQDFYVSTGGNMLVFYGDGAQFVMKKD